MEVLAVGAGSTAFLGRLIIPNSLMYRLLHLLERVKGIEAFTDNPQVAQIEHIPGDDARGYTQIRAQIEKPLEPDLAAVVAAWPVLSAPLKAAIVPIANTATHKEGQ